MRSLCACRPAITISCTRIDVRSQIRPKEILMSLICESCMHTDSNLWLDRQLHDFALRQGEAARWQKLQPFLVSSPKRGIVGNSRYAKRIRSQILAASKADTGCFPICLSLCVQETLCVRFFSRPFEAQIIQWTEDSMQNIIMDTGMNADVHSLDLPGSRCISSGSLAWRRMR
jgi:hypothetical protein